MEPSRKLFYGALGFAAVLVIVIALSFGRENAPAGQVPISGDDTVSPRDGLSNAFTGGGGSRLAPIVPSASGGLKDKPADPPVAQQNTLPTLDEIGKKFIAPLLPALSMKDTLPLPAVSDAEIKIDSSGAKTAREYQFYVSQHSEEVHVAGSDLNSIARGADGGILMPWELVAQGVERGTMAGLLPSIATWRKYVEAQTSFLLKIKTWDKAVAPHKTNIGIERLTEELLGKASVASPGNDSWENMKSFFARYEATVDVARRSFASEVGGIEGYEPSFLEKVAGFFGIAPAYAQGGTPFGSRITYIDQEMCDCSEPGNLADMSGVKPPPTGTLFVPIYFRASPLFYQKRSFSEGKYWLGLTSGVSVCMVYHGEECDYKGTGDRIMMTGTN